jgi:iron(III) transport system ATP-binding protein
MTRIELDRVSKRYAGNGQLAAVEDATFTVESGEFFTLLGPSGCGKTTTLRMIAGFLFPTEGTIRFDTDAVTNRPAHKRGTGMVFQNYALFPHMSVAENVAYGLKVRHVAKEQRRARVEEALAQVHLKGYADRRIDELSGGQQQRVALARALVIRPRVLLLDEPLSNLDAKLREDTRREIRAIQTEAKTTALYVTHDQAEAMAVSDRIAVMESGHVHQVGSPREIYYRPATAFVARFIGNSNVLSSTVVAGSGTTRTVRLTGSGGEQVDVAVNAPAQLADGDEALIAVRPEHIEVVPAGTEGSLTAVVQSYEFTGLTTNLVLDLAGTPVGVTVVDGDAPAQPGQSVGIRVHAGKPQVVRA